MPAARFCAITNLEICREFYINLLVTDAILLSIMLAGLLRLRRRAGGPSYLSQLLWKQVGPLRVLVGRDVVTSPLGILEGVIWLIIAIAAELPQMVSPNIFIVHGFFKNYCHFTP